MCTVGTDPEIFVTTRGNLLPAYEFLPSKRHAKEFRSVSGGAVKTFWDGFQAEFTTYGHPCIAWLVDDIQGGLKAIRQEARVQHINAELSLDSVVEVPKAIRRVADVQHVMLGCDPSMNVYGLHGEEIFDARELPWRTAAMHVHLGLDPSERKDTEDLVKCLDAILGVWCVGAARNIDNPLRRRYYGLAGEFRLPPHGIEYRTPSNFALCHPAIANLFFEIARGALRWSLGKRRRAWDASDREVVEVVNNCDVKGAEAILERNALNFLDVLTKVGPSGGQMGLQVGLNGVETAIKNPRDLAGNWFLDGEWTCHSEGKNCTWADTAQQMQCGNRV